MLHAIKKKDAEDVGDRKHSRAMSREDMEKLSVYAEKDCPSKEAAEQFVHTGDGYYQPLFPELLSKRAKHLNYNVFKTISWATWTR